MARRGRSRTRARTRTRSGRPRRRRAARSSPRPCRAGSASRRAGSPASQLKQATSSSTLGSVNGKKCGRRRTSRSSPKTARANASSVPWRSASVMSSSTARPSSWWNCGVCVRVVVAPVAAPGDHDVQRRRVRAPSRAPASARCACAGRCRRRRRTCPTHSRAGCVDVVVERVEVVVDGVDLGALDDAEAEADEDVLELAPRLGQQVQAPDRLGGRAGQRDVDDVGGEPRVELGAVELGLARLERRLERRGAPRWRPCRRSPRSSGGSWATPRSRCGSSALRPRYSMRTRSSSSEEPARSTACAAASSICWMRSIIARPRTLPPSRPSPR